MESKNALSNTVENSEFHIVKKAIIPRFRNDTLNSKKNIETTEINLRNNQSYLSFSQIILIFYFFIFTSTLIYIFSLSWSSIWQLPKSIIFIFGVTGLLFLTAILWIFGYIRHSVNITLGDILSFLIGISIIIITFINPNKISFWGTTNRIFDAGIFMVFLFLFYILIKLFLESRSFNIIIVFLSIFIILSSGIGATKIYIPSLFVNISILTKLQPTYTWLTEYPQELVFLTLITHNIIFWALHKSYHKKIINLFLVMIYYLSLLIHILILIRLTNKSMYILTILTIIIHTILYISYLSQHYKLNSKIKSIANRKLLISGLLIIAVFYSMFVRPFQNNTHFAEYPVLANPNLNLSLDIATQSLRGDTWFGSSNIIYAWNRFSNSDFNLGVPNFSFETLSNEFINIIVKNGIVILILLILLFLWIIFSMLRVILIQKTFPIELYILSISIIGLFLIPFTVITKILCVFILILWGNILNKYFKPIFSFNLDINKIPASISSLFTFIILLAIAISLLASSKMYNILKSQEYVVKASEAILSDQVQLLSQAQNKSPYMIEYANLYMQSFIKQINEQSIQLFNTSEQDESGINSNIYNKNKSDLQVNIDRAQELIDYYKSKFALDSRVIYWQLDLYSTIDNYKYVKESDYLSNIGKGKELQPNTISWDLYEAQYYTKQAQKEMELNIEKFNKSKTILSSLLDKNSYNIEVYKNYYDLLALNNDYKEQISILDKYVNLLRSKDMLVDYGLVYSLAVAYQNDEQYDKAIMYYNRLLETFPDYTNVYFKLGEIYEAQNKLEDAIQKYKKVLELDPKADLAQEKVNKLEKLK